MEEQTNNQNKLFNIFLLGDIKSEKKNIFQEILQNEQPDTTQPFEIQGEVISMKILEDYPIENIFSTEGGSITSQAILLFYNVTDIESFNQLKEILSKIKEMNQNDIPVNIIGNIPDSSERILSYDDAKNFSETYGIKYHEISFENVSANINDILKDVGEQVLCKVNAGINQNEETAQKESSEQQNDNEEKKENENNEANEASNQEVSGTENQQANETENQEVNQTENQEANETENQEVNQTENQEANQTENQEVNQTENQEENQVENQEANQTENQEVNQTENQEVNQTEENKEENQTEENKEENQAEENKEENQTEENKEENQTEENKEVNQTENNEVNENENKEVNETENNGNETLEKKESENIESTQNNENENTQNNEEVPQTENNENENNQENENEKNENENNQVEENANDKVENEQNNENATNENNENESNENGEGEGQGEGEGEGGDSKIKKSRSKEDISNVKKKKTLMQMKKQKEDELLEKKLKKEKEMQEWYKKKEQESIELKKKKAIEDKIKLKEKIKEDKIIQKQREKEVKEENYNQKKEIVEKTKKDKEEVDKKNSLEKERSKTLLEQTRKNDKENLKKVLFENEQQEKEYLKKMREKFNSPDRSTKNDRYDYDYPPNLSQTEKMDVSTSQTLKMNKTYRQLGSTSRSPKKAKTKKSKSLAKTKLMKSQIEKENIELKLKELNDREEREEREEKERIYQEKMKVINELKDNYLNNSNVYRCLCCSKIPIININEFNHQIETICNCNVNFYNNNKNNKFVSSYKYFEENSLDHPLDMNISCKYCKKTIDQLSKENLELNFCPICNDIICSKHELFHKNQKHKTIKELKDKYKTLSMSKNKKLKGKKPAIKKKFQPMFKRSRTPKKADMHKAASTRKNAPVTLRGNKYGAKVASDKKDNVPLMDNNEEIKILEEEKIPIYLNDSCCIKHKQIFNSYCYNCLKNICTTCEENEHKAHKIVNLKTLMMEEDKLINIKEALDNDMKNLNIINDYFDKLIERIKDQYLNYFYTKKKEIEIKQKIIQDYEAIKYNYNCIKNLNNIKYINLNNNKDPIITDLENNFNRNTNDDLLSELKLIFNYLNQSSQSTNLINYNKTKKHLIASPNEEISDIIKLDTNDISVSFFNGKMSVYDNEDFNQKLTCKIFDNNEGINYMKQLKNGDLACCGYKKLKIVNLNLSKKTFTLVKELNIDEGSFNMVEELRNHFLVTYDTGNKLKLWKKYQLVHETTSDTNIDSLLIRNDSSFLTSSYDNRKIDLYDINIDETNYININRTSLDNISVKKIANLNNNYIVAIFEEKDLLKIIFDEKFEESKNEEETKNNESENGLCLIQVNTNNDLKIVQKIKYKDEGKFYINLINYDSGSVLLLNHYGFIELWNFDKINKKMYIINQFKAIDDYFGRIIRNIIFIEDNKEIILQSYKHVFCLLRD